MANIKLPSVNVINEMDNTEIFALADTIKDSINSAKLTRLSKEQVQSALWDSPLNCLGNKTIQETLANDKLASARIIGALTHSIINKVVVSGL